MLAVGVVEEGRRMCPGGHGAEAGGPPVCSRMRRGERSRRRGDVMRTQRPLLVCTLWQGFGTFAKRPAGGDDDV